MALTCLYTIVRNTSGAARYFDYLPPHGRRLADDEEMSVPGELVAWMKGNLRKMRGLADDLNDGAIAIVQTPQQHVNVTDDSGLDVFRAVTIERNATTDEDEVVATTPCWESTAADSPAASP